MSSFRLNTPPSYDGELFKVNKDNVYFVIASSEKESEILNLKTGKSKIVYNNRLPVGALCHAYVPKMKGAGEQYFYDISFKESFFPKTIKIGAKPTSYAMYVKDCLIRKSTVNGNDEVSLEAPIFGFHIKEVHPSYDRYDSLKKYVPVNESRMDCWVTPVKYSSDTFQWLFIPYDYAPPLMNSNTFQWLFIPYDYTPPLMKYDMMYGQILDKMKKMFSKEYTGLGVVVGIGKIAIRKHLLNCPNNFELGSTRVCIYEKMSIDEYATMVLLKSKPVKLKKKYLETFVTPGGSVLIKTVSGTTSHGNWSLNVEDTNPLQDGEVPKRFLAPKDFNFSYHPFFGTILMSNKLIWSAVGTKIIIGGTINVEKEVLSDFEYMCKIRYNVLGFHDGEKYWRVPDIPTEMFDSRNFLIENGVPLWGEPLNLSKKLHPPQALFEKLEIEGRFFSYDFIKKIERNVAPKKKEESDSLSDPDPDVCYVTHSSKQNSANIWE
uniref:Uncharacterized protein n=1 Tax=Panagrolaimus sp. ES5 TaxID=591445 RepID=A0AC34F8Z6_9BILA